MSLDHLRKLNQQIKPSRYNDYRLYLKALYDATKEALGSYSYQQFADDLGYGKSTVMHQIVKGYRPLTLKALQKLIHHLQLKGHERSYLQTLVTYNNAKKVKDKDEHFQKLLQLKSESLPTGLDQNMLLYFSEWYHPVIREMVALKDFKADAKWIEKKLIPHISMEKIRQSLTLLESLGMIRWDEDEQRYVQTNTVIDSGPGVKGLGLIGYHQSMIDRAKEALGKVKGKRRNISAVTVRCSEENAKKMKALIQTFQTELVALAESDPGGDQIYQINLQLFPFTEESSS